MPLLSTTITLQINGGETKELGANDTPAVFPRTNPLLFNQVILSNGTGSARAEKIGMAGFSLTGGASLTLDFMAADGPFADVDFDDVKFLIIDNQSEEAAVSVGDDGTVSNPWTSAFLGTNARIKCRAGFPTVIPAPYEGMDVGSGNRNLLIKNLSTGTNTASGNVLLIGEGA